MLLGLGGAGVLLGERVARLNHLLDAFLRYLLLKQQYETYLQEVNEAEIEAAIEGLTAQIAVQNPAQTRGSLPVMKKRLEVLQKRKARIDEIQATVAKVTESLATIEEIFQLICENITLAESADEIVFLVDDTLQNEEVVGQIERDTARLRLSAPVEALDNLEGLAR